MEPQSESHVELELVGSDGKKVRLLADCYFEPGYKGDLFIDFNEKTVVSVNDEIALY